MAAMSNLRALLMRVLGRREQQPEYRHEDWEACGEYTGLASNRCMLPPGHAGPHDCQLIPGDADYMAALADFPAGTEAPEREFGPASLARPWFAFEGQEPASRPNGEWRPNP